MHKLVVKVIYQRAFKNELSNYIVISFAINGLRNKVGNCLLPEQ